jgi:hypothetical protein
MNRYNHASNNKIYSNQPKNTKSNQIKKKLFELLYTFSGITKDGNHLY